MGGGICVSGSFRVSAFRGHDVGRVWPKRRPCVRCRLQRREGLYLHVFDHLFTLQRGNAELEGGWSTPAEQMRVNWMHPCGASLTLKAGSGWDSPFQFTHAYVCQSEGVMPAVTLPPPFQTVLYWQLPTSPWATRQREEDQAGEGCVCGGGKNMVLYFLLYVGTLTNKNLKGKLTKGWSDGVIKRRLRKKKKKG